VGKYGTQEIAATLNGSKASRISYISRHTNSLSLGAKFEALSITPETRVQAFPIRINGSKRAGLSFGIKAQAPFDHCLLVRIPGYL
jgi:hypothetical protein